ncbi:hypothetical protein GCM10017600_76720 [Streptosporangium carneum]|uniref:Uncharacterized protein n=1 Tax=Streptosporangium carneum TaxID=47481 RepID=A0A9W6MHJ8_9ACTN|nr:hypothetical protein GCM10017600_76720 [Streptosporangium carneum]
MEGKRLTAGLKAVVGNGKGVSPEKRAAAVRAFFKKLKADERSWPAAHQAGTVGGLDGAPTPVRFAANRLLIERALTHEQRELARLKAAAPKSPQVSLSAADLKPPAGTPVFAMRAPATGCPVPMPTARTRERGLSWEDHRLARRRASSRSRGEAPPCLVTGRRGYGPARPGCR